LLGRLSIQNFFHELVFGTQLALHEPEALGELGDLQRIGDGGGGVHLLLERRQSGIAVLAQPLVARLLHFLRQAQHVPRNAEQIAE